jgi:hypothetical protein
MSRILSRPMFKRGGTTNTGIMDGFEDMNTEDRVQASTGPFIDPLMRYDVAGAKTARDEAEAALREGAITAQYDPTYDQGLALARAGFKLASAPGGQPILQTIGQVAGESIGDFEAIGEKKAESAAKQAELGTSINLATFEQAQSDYNTARELAADLDIAQENKEKVSIILDESIRLRGLIADPDTSEAARSGYIDDLLQLNVQSREARIALQKDLPDLIKQFKFDASDYQKIVAQGDQSIKEYLETTGVDLTKYKGMTTDQIATQMAKDSIDAIAPEIFIPEVGAQMKEGGRVEAQEGKFMAPTEQGQSPRGSMGLTFQELRARLPQEVSDEVVRLIATSEEALLDFANLETQDDIALFNQKYQSDLQLPSQVA